MSEKGIFKMKKQNFSDFSFQTDTIHFKNKYIIEKLYLPSLKTSSFLSFGKFFFYFYFLFKCTTLTQIFVTFYSKFTHL